MVEEDRDVKNQYWTIPHPFFVCMITLFDGGGQIGSQQEGIWCYYDHILA